MGGKRLLSTRVRITLPYVANSGFTKDSTEYEAAASMYVDRVLYLYKHPEYIGNYLSVDWSNISFDDYVPEEVMTSYLIDVAGLPPEMIDAVKEKIRV